MRFLTEDLPVDPAPAGLVAAVVAAAVSSAGAVTDTASDLSDLLMVTIPSMDPEIQWGPCRWQARDSTSMPTRGDKALVAFDENEEPWVISWWPFG